MENKGDKENNGKTGGTVKRQRHALKLSSDTIYSNCTADEGLGKQLEVSEVRSIDKTNGGNAREDMRRTSEGMKRLPDISDCEDRIDRALERLLAKKKSAKNLYTVGVSLKEKIQNATLYQLADTQDITQAAITSKWKWGGHVARIPGDRWTYRASMWDPRIGRRLQGRPQRRRADFFKEQAGTLFSEVIKDTNVEKIGHVYTTGTQRVLELNGLPQLLVYADDVNMLEENPQAIRGNAEILVEASKAIGLEVNPEKTKYMIMSRDQNIVRNGNIKIGDLSLEEVQKFKYLGATITNINDTREEIKRRINMGNACYYSVEKLLSSSLLSKSLKVRIYKTVILPVVLYGCETWTLTLREEQRLRVFENKVLRKIFGAKRDEVTGEWRKLHNTELHALYTSPDIIRTIKSRRLRWVGHVARMGESRNAYRVLVGRPEGKRPLGMPRRRWEDNIKIDLREVGYDGRDWINLAQDRDQWRAYVRAAMNLRVP
ncbi:hypothetical protein ANN_05375 [Periplaneta americana]|uniref:Reverse transcriptase domain-containing protein n=1 Tax=Periplaneta americana TaxID=6978 RepID=A0ABQ8TDG3_PERAM|nr:hypothetical protein ANN_05375 [Periplaneta americana]